MSPMPMWRSWSGRCFRMRWSASPAATSTSSPVSADVSAETHISYRETPVQRVLSIMPAKYADIWTAAKGFYKLEPIVADGGEVIIYAPHITEISVMHPHISEIGYHNRDYFLANGTASKTSRGATWPTPPTCAGRAAGTPNTANGTGSP